VTDFQGVVSIELIERLKKEREELRQQIEESLKTIERSQDLLAQLDAMLMKVKGI
jgi:hypothetical protein